MPPLLLPGPCTAVPPDRRPAARRPALPSCPLPATSPPPTEILPKHFGWATVFSDRPKLEAWWAAVQADPEAARVIGARRGEAQGSATLSSLLGPLLLLGSLLLLPPRRCFPLAAASRLHRLQFPAPHRRARPARPAAAEMRSGLQDWESAKRWDTLGIAAQVADGSFNWSCA